MTSTRHFNVEICDNAAFFICPVLLTHIWRIFSVRANSSTTKTTKDD